MSDHQEKTDWIKEHAESLGFCGIGIARAEFMTEESDRLQEWLSLGYQGKMAYMENHFDKRVDPTKLVDNAQSVISLAYNYYTEVKQKDADAPKISQYAYGRDYHKVVKKKLKLFFQDITKRYGVFDGRYFVDSAPILERDWAKRAGLGWIGKNTMLINPKMGSFFFLAEMIVDFSLIYDQPIDDYCGTCTRCIDACPTSAIDEKGYLMDGSKCISYLTIELKDEKLPAEHKGQMDNWMYGCDVCQDVCPWNRFSSHHKESDFIPKNELIEMTSQEWSEMTEETFSDLFFGSPVKRTGYNGLKRNIEFVNKDKAEK